MTDTKDATAAQTAENAQIVPVVARIDAAPAVPAPTEAEIAQAWATYSQQQRIGKPMVAAFVLDMLAKYAATAASAGGPAGDTYPCKAWGETDLACGGYRRRYGWCARFPGLGMARVCG
jgi:hypothetical protein